MMPLPREILRVLHSQSSFLSEILAFPSLSCRTDRPAARDAWRESAYFASRGGDRPLSSTVPEFPGGVRAGALLPSSVPVEEDGGWALRRGDRAAPHRTAPGELRRPPRSGPRRAGDGTPPMASGPAQEPRPRWACSGRAAPGPRRGSGPLSPGAWPGPRQA